MCLYVSTKKQPFPKNFAASRHSTGIDFLSLVVTRSVSLEFFHVRKAFVTSIAVMQLSSMGRHVRRELILFSEGFVTFFASQFTTIAVHRVIMTLQVVPITNG